MYLSPSFKFQNLYFSIASIHSNKHHIAPCRWRSLVFWDFCHYVLIVINNLSSYYIISLIISFIFFPVLPSFAIIQFVVLLFFLFFSFDFLSTCWEFQVALVLKNPSANAEDIRTEDLIPGLERSCGGSHSNPFQDSCLENSMDRAAWQTK